VRRTLISAYKQDRPHEWPVAILPGYSAAPRMIGDLFCSGRASILRWELPLTFSNQVEASQKGHAE
jgi:hypothetical protein